MSDESTMTPSEFWEERYSSSDQVWSGRANRFLPELTAGLSPGSSLDLGCGECADTIWFASQGWDATGVDLSTTATQRAKEAAAAAGIPAERIHFEAADLESWEPNHSFDLVTASFFHSFPAPVPREEILRKATGWVASGGHFLMVSHGAPPPWADTNHIHRHEFPTVDSEVANLELDSSEWQVEIAEIRQREAVGPDGQQAMLDDVVVLASKRP